MHSQWKHHLLEAASTKAIPAHDHPAGLGLDFTDDQDTLWILPNNPLSSIPLETPLDIDKVLQLYTELNELRTKALHVLRHYFASLRIKVEPRSARGDWSLEYEGGATSSVTVGAWLTSVAFESRSVHETVRRRCKQLHGMRPPSEKRIDRYLAIPTPPAEVATVPSPPSTEENGDLRQAVKAMGMWRALENVEEGWTEETLMKKAEPTGRIAQALLRVADRIPGIQGGCDMLKPGLVRLPYPDGLDSYEVESRNRGFAKRLHAMGPEGMGDRIAAEFQEIGRKRAEVLNAIRRAGAKRGWKRDEQRLSLFGGNSVLSMGLHLREVEFDPAKALTEAVQKSPLDSVLREMFHTQNPAFGEECVAELAQPGDAPELPEGTLLPKNHPLQPKLLELDPTTIARMDAFAKRILANYLHAERTIWEYQNKDLFDPAIDTWSTQAEWVALAEKKIKTSEAQGWTHAMAMLILLDAGDARVEGWAREKLPSMEPNEPSSADTELMWRMQHVLPSERAKAWFGPQEWEDVPHAEIRRKSGDPIAVRHRSRGEEEENPDSQLEYSADAIARLSEAEREKVHHAFVEWARTDHRMSPPNAERLRTAFTSGWFDVADHLFANPFFLPCLFRYETRYSDGMDEPGLLFGGEFLLTYSRYYPTQMLARLLATAEQTDFIAEATKASEASLARGTADQSSVNIVKQALPTWLDALWPQVAIAWTRCRKAISCTIGDNAHSPS